MNCPHCGGGETQVKDSRSGEDGQTIRRRRFCGRCGRRFTTYERIHVREIIVVKRSGARQPFDREKLERSITIAIRKRSLDVEKVDRMISAIVRQLEEVGDGAVLSTRLGELVMEHLKGLDRVAYVRYASVYRDFQEAADFASFLKAGGFPR